MPNIYELTTYFDITETLKIVHVFYWIYKKRIDEFRKWVFGVVTNKNFK
jgi:hypothetical protein